MRALRLTPRSIIVALFLAPLFITFANAAGSAEAAIPTSARIQPADLAAMLRAAGSHPVILQVGSRVLYTEAHIPGSQYAGPGAQQDGIQNLKNHVDGLSRDQLLVIYCGCCPWTRCPNVAPAYTQLRAMGFSNVKVLYLADNFGADWVSKGYPTVRGE